MCGVADQRQRIEAEGGGMKRRHAYNNLAAANNRKAPNRAYMYVYMCVRGEGGVK